MKLIKLAVLLMFAACASKSNNSEIFSVDGVAIRGYDVVAFHQGKQLKGQEKYSYTFKNSKWLFAEKANLDSFESNPGRYEPQYGGYCAFGTAEGHKAPTEPETFTLREGKLYFNYNKEVQDLWNRDQSGFINKADSLWPSVKDDEF